MLKRSRFFALLCLLATSPALFADHQLQPFRAEYSILRNGSEVGVRIHTLVRQQDHYLYEGRMHTTGFASLLKPGEVVERSEWQLVDNRVVPRRYDYRDSSDTSRSLRLQFNWDKHSVTNDVGKRPWKMHIPAGTQDKFGYLLSLMRDLEHGEHNPEYQVADGGRLKTYRFKRLGEETITTPAGVFHTVKYRRTRADKQHRFTDVWCLPAKQFLPVKIERHKQDVVYMMVLNQLDGP